MAPVLSIRFTEKEYSELQKKCNTEGIAVSSYIKNVLFPEREKKSNYLTNEIIVKKIKEIIKCKDDKIDATKPFFLSDLFDDDEYIQYYNFIPAGKTFFKYASTPGTDAYNLVEALGGKPAKYRIK